MHIRIIQEELSHLPAHEEISIAFEVQRVLDLTVVDSGLRGLVLDERELLSPYVKNYDDIAGNRPSDWIKCFDMTNWAFLSAWVDDRRVGGVVIAFRTKGLDMLEQREDIAAIWDLRVAPHFRGRGVGSALFAAAATWAQANGCLRLKVETQNVNVAACRFYARQGCSLGAIHRFAYPSLPEEIQFLWYKDVDL
jgi:GNAT superfamily N-acetyltransferase